MRPFVSWGKRCTSKAQAIHATLMVNRENMGEVLKSIGVSSGDSSPPIRAKDEQNPTPVALDRVG